MKQVKKDPAIILFCDARSGRYIPQRFAAEIMPQYLHGVSQDELNELADPNSEWYWEIWNTVLNNASVIGANGENYMLHHDGDLWLLDCDRMTEEERENFGFNE